MRWLDGLLSKFVDELVVVGAVLFFRGASICCFGFFFAFVEKADGSKESPCFVVLTYRTCGSVSSMGYLCLTRRNITGRGRGNRGKVKVGRLEKNMQSLRVERGVRSMYGSRLETGSDVEAAVCLFLGGKRGRVRRVILYLQVHQL